MIVKESYKAVVMLFTIIYVIVFTFLIVGSPVNVIASLGSSTSEPEEQPTPFSSCVTFDSEEKIITVTCSNINLIEIDKVLKDPNVLRRDEAVENGWILTAGIVVAADSLLYINSTDASWLKIIPDHNNQVYNNTVSKCANGIYLRSESSNNEIYNNTIRDTNQGIYVNTGASDNEFRSNSIINATELGININEGESSEEDAGSNNALLNDVLVDAELADTHEEEGHDEEDTPDED